jgi:hypothetical protein
MPDVIVHEDEGQEIEDQSAHDAAVAEGAAEVHEEHAEESADEARAAAEVAASAAQANIEAVGMAAEAAQAAEGAAGVAVEAESRVVEAIQAQSAVIASLVDELKASREAAASKPEPDKPTKTADKPPSKRGLGHRYYGR